jgi:hypothetical protein
MKCDTYRNRCHNERKARGWQRLGPEDKECLRRMSVSVKIETGIKNTKKCQGTGMNSREEQQNANMQTICERDARIGRIDHLRQGW